MSKKNSLEAKRARRIAKANKPVTGITKRSTWIEVEDRYGRKVKKQVLMPVRRAG